MQLHETVILKRIQMNGRRYTFGPDVMIVSATLVSEDFQTNQ